MPFPSGQRPADPYRSQSPATPQPLHTKPYHYTLSRSPLARSPTSSSQRSNSTLGGADWAAVPSDFGPTTPVKPTAESKSKHTPSSHNRTRSLASKLYSALSINKRDSGPAPRVKITDIGAPVANPDSSSTFLGGVSQLDNNASVNTNSVSRSHRWPLRASSPLWDVQESPVTHRNGLHMENDPPHAEPRSQSTIPSSATMLAHHRTSSMIPGASTPPPSRMQSGAHSRHYSASAANELSLKALRPPNRMASRHDSHDTQHSQQGLPPSPLPSTGGRPLTPNMSGTSSIRSQSSAQFRIRRKPPPRLTEQEFLALNPHLHAHPQPPPTSVRNETMSKLSGPVEQMADKDNIPTARAGEITDKGSLSRSTRHMSLESRALNDERQTAFRLELDRLFDELFEECSVGRRTHGTPNSGHSRSRSDFPELHTSNFRRTAAVRRPTSRAILGDSQAGNIPRPPSSHDGFKAKSTNPFYSGRHSGSLRRSSRPHTAPSGLLGRPGRVRNAVLEIERKNSASPSSLVSTPIKNLGSILDRNVGPDSTELTLESKRMMEEARRRRAEGAVSR